MVKSQVATSKNRQRPSLRPSRNSAVSHNKKQSVITTEAATTAVTALTGTTNSTRQPSKKSTDTTGNDSSGAATIVPTLGTANDDITNSNSRSVSFSNDVTFPMNIDDSIDHDMFDDNENGNEMGFFDDFGTNNGDEEDGDKNNKEQSSTTTIATITTAKTKTTKKRPAPLRRPPPSNSSNTKKNNSSSNTKKQKAIQSPSTKNMTIEEGNNDESAVAPSNPSATTESHQQQQQQQQQQQSISTIPPGMAVVSCPNCGSTAIEQHEASGATVCTDCGVVVEENAIVSSIEFVEGTGGSSNMVGQFVSATSSKAYTSGGGSGSGGHNIRGGGRYGFSRDSRETTLVNGRRRIQELASRLRLSSHYIDSAHRLFTVAVERNFVQGRRTSHVVAACLYIACRQEKSQHMLIDFSDALQVNVYTLGTCFLKFRRLLGLKLEIIDPALYVYRFAAHLDLDDRANAVSLTSLRLVARMKRDWIVAGRRPAGICAAALLIAARAHGFDKHCADVTRILRVCGMTVTNRIREFERTPTAYLSLEQFQTIDFEAEADPPVYTKNKIREARAKAIQEQNVPLLTSGVLDDDGKHGSRWRASQQKQKVPSERAVKFQELYQSLDKKLTDMQGGNNNGDDQDEVRNATTDQAPIENQDAAQLVVRADNLNDEEAVSALTPWKEAYPKNRGRDIILPSEATTEEQLPSIVPTEAQLNLSEWKLSLPNEIDLEIEDIFRTSQEEKEKEAIFNKINKDYIAQQERKESERLDIEAAAKDQDADDIAQAAGHARYKDVVQQRTMSNKGRNRHGGANQMNRDGSDPTTGNTATTTSTTEEQLRAAVASRKVSRKINYDALSSIFDDDGSFATTTGLGGEFSNDVDDDDDNHMNQMDDDMF